MVQFLQPSKIFRCWICLQIFPAQIKKGTNITLLKPDPDRTMQRIFHQPKYNQLFQMPELFHYHENVTEIMEQEPSLTLNLQQKCRLMKTNFYHLVFSQQHGWKPYWKKPDVHSHCFTEELLNIINTNKFKILLCGFGLVLNQELFLSYSQTLQVFFFLNL